MSLRNTLGTAAAAAAAAVTLSCVHQTRVVNRPPQTVASRQTVWERQIQTAKDAGDGDYQLRVIREKVAAESDNIAARLELAKAYQERGYPDVALEICRLASARFPESREVELALVRALRVMNRRNEASDSLEAFLAAHPPKSADFASWAGILRDESGQWSAGEAWHRKALELDGTQDSLHNNLGYNLLMQQKNDEAAQEFREALKLNPASQVARNNLGLALASQDAAVEAVASFQSAADAATAHNNLAALWMEKGNYPAARKELELALRYNGNFPAALRNLELLSRLDGSPASFQARQSETGWERWKAGFKKLFVGSLDEPRKDAAKPATAPANEEEQ
jgi:tetratricopeptide (TPR) repeat protein